MRALRRVLPEIDLESGVIPADVLNKIVVRMSDFQDALTEIEPSALREVLVEVPDVHWTDIGGLSEVKKELEESVEWPIVGQLHDLVSRRADDMRLTPQQERVLELSAEGLTYREIGARLYISESTVRFHVQKLKAKFGARTKAELIARAIRSGALAPAAEALGSP